MLISGQFRVISCVILATLSLAAGQFRMRDMGNRLEGVEDLQESESLSQVRGFFAYRDEKAFRPDTALHILFFDPPNEDRPIAIEAQEINDRNHYHMLPKQLKSSPGRWVEFSGWPVRDFLYPLHISPSQLTVVVRLSAQNMDETELTPAILYQSAYPPTVDHYTLAWKSDQNLSELTYQLIGPQGPGRRVTYSDKNGDTELDAVDTHSLEIDATNLPDGWYSIHLRGTRPNSRRQLEVAYRFFRKRNVEP